MTNREKFLRELSKLSNLKLADVFCDYQSECKNCPFNERCNACMTTPQDIADWLREESKDDQN